MRSSGAVRNVATLLSIFAPAIFAPSVAGLAIGALTAEAAEWPSPKAHLATRQITGVSIAGRPAAESTAVLRTRVGSTGGKGSVLNVVRSGARLGGMIYSRAERVDAAAGAQALAHSPVQFEFPAVGVPTLFTGDWALRVDVPETARRLEIRLSNSTPGVRAVVQIRRNSAPELFDGRVVSDIQGADADLQSVVFSRDAAPLLQPGSYFVAFSVPVTEQPVRVSVAALLDADAVPVNRPGKPLEFDSGTTVEAQGPGEVLLTGLRGAYLEVPEGLVSVTVCREVSPPSWSAPALYARFRRPPELLNGRVVADWLNEDTTADPCLQLANRDGSTLEAGVYYIALGIGTLTPNARLTIHLTASARHAALTENGLLLSGIPVQTTLHEVDVPTLFTGSDGYRIEVPPGAARLVVELRAANRANDVDLYVRRNQPVSATGGMIVADWISDGFLGDERLVIEPPAGGELRPGTYFVGIGVFALYQPVAVTLVARAEMAHSDVETQVLVPGVSATITLPPVEAALFAGTYACRIDVPAGASRLEIRTVADQAADVDLYVRFGIEPTLRNGDIIADAVSEGLNANERVVLGSPLGERLRPGSYYIAFVSRTPGAAVSLAVRAFFR